MFNRVAKKDHTTANARSSSNTSSSSSSNTTPAVRSRTYDPSQLSDAELAALIKKTEAEAEELRIRSEKQKKLLAPPNLLQQFDNFTRTSTTKTTGILRNGARSGNGNSRNSPEEEKYDSSGDKSTSSNLSSDTSSSTVIKQVSKKKHKHNHSVMFLLDSAPQSSMLTTLAHESASVSAVQSNTVAYVPSS